MRPLEPHEHEVYDLPQVTSDQASVYEHCLRALRKACTACARIAAHRHRRLERRHERVGVEGKVRASGWRGSCADTARFAGQAGARGDEAVAAELRAQADAYEAAVEENGWDGAWYRRAYFDDGTPLGSATSEECRIDSIAQSWSVISAAATAERAARAMRSLEEHLVREDARLLMLLDAPSIRRRWTPATSRAICPASGRTAPSTRTPRSGWCWPPRSRATATAPSSSTDDQPAQPRATPQQVERYKVEPYVVAADVYTASAHSAAGAGPGTRAPRAGCTGSGSRPFSASTRPVTR